MDVHFVERPIDADDNICDLIRPEPVSMNLIDPPYARLTQ